MTEKIVIVYKTQDNKEPFTDWLFSLRDIITRHRIETRIDRIRQGNYGNHKRFQGIIELRLDFGKGYRLYPVRDKSLNGVRERSSLTGFTAEKMDIRL